MKIFRHALQNLIAALFAVAIGGAAHAQTLLTPQVLLKIDVSNANEVVITGTGLGSLATTGSYDSGDGIELLKFFTGDQNNPTFPAGSNTLGTANEGLTFDYTAVDYDYQTGEQTGLDIYDIENSGQISFTAGSAAFNTGTLTVNLGSLTALRSQGTTFTGDIVAGFSGGGPGNIIGQWEIVAPAPAPEPSTWLLLVGAFALLPLVQRLRRARS